jgi:hypothetical protein
MFPVNYRACQSQTNFYTRDSVCEIEVSKVIKRITTPYGILVVFVLQFVSEKRF